MKFYHIENANRSITLGKFSIQFHPYEMCGSWLGVYSTDKSDEIASLDEGIKNPRSGITSISELEYTNALKKKAVASGGYMPSLAATTPTPGVVADSVGEPVTGSEALSPEQPPVAPLDSVDEAIPVVKVSKKKK